MGSWALILILLSSEGVEYDRKVNPALSAFENKNQCIDYARANHVRLRREGIWVRGSKHFKFDCVAISTEEGLPEIFNEQVL